VAAVIGAVFNPWMIFYQQAAIADKKLRPDDLKAARWDTAVGAVLMPILLKEAGLSPQRATLISALFPLGGVGAVLSGVLMDRFNPNRVVAACFALTAISVYGIGQAVGNVGWLVFTVFAAGVLMNTAQSSMPALAAAFYPTQGRGTGVGWMLGIGPVRRNRRIVPGRRTDKASLYVWWHLRGGCSRRCHFMYCAVRQTGRTPTVRNL
jgi:MFS family permease